MTYKCLLLRWGFAPDPKVYRFTEDIHPSAGQLLPGKEKEYRPQTIPYVLATAALESVLTVALSSDAAR